MIYDWSLVTIYFSVSCKQSCVNLVTNYEFNSYVSFRPVIFGTRKSDALRNEKLAPEITAKFLE